MRRFLVVLVVLAVAPPAASAAPRITTQKAQAAVERYAAHASDADSYTVDRCRVGARRAKCRLREWGMSDDLPWLDGPSTPYEAEYTAVVRLVRGRLVVHLAGVCDERDRSPACDY